MDREGFVFDSATLSTQPPAFLFVSNGLVFVIKWSPESLLEFVLDGLVVLDIVNVPFPVYFTWINQMNRYLFRILHMHRPEVDKAIL